MMSLKSFGAGKALHMFSLLMKTFMHLKPQLVYVIIPILLSVNFLLKFKKFWTCTEPYDGELCNFRDLLFFLKNLFQRSRLVLEWTGHYCRFSRTNPEA